MVRKKTWTGLVVKKTTSSAIWKGVTPKKEVIAKTQKIQVSSGISVSDGPLKYKLLSSSVASFQFLIPVHPEHPLSNVVHDMPSFLFESSDISAMRESLRLALSTVTTVI